LEKYPLGHLAGGLPYRMHGSKRGGWRNKLRHCALPLPNADALQPPLRCAATRKRDGRTPSKLARASREVPGNRTLWHPGAPTQTCYGVIHSAKLWGQCTKRWEPHPAKG